MNLKKIAPFALIGFVSIFSISTISNAYTTKQNQVCGNGYQQQCCNEKQTCKKECCNENKTCKKECCSVKQTYQQQCCNEK